MPMLDDGSGNMVQQVLALAQIAQNRRQQQGQNLINTAQPGQTVKDLGMTPQMFAAMFGKDTPYDPNKQVRDVKATDLIDDQVKRFIRQMSPDQALNLAAGTLSRGLGGPGLTTPTGLAASQQTGEVQAVAGQHSAESVAKMIDEGIQAMSKAPSAVRTSIGQQAAYGTDATTAEYNNLKGQLGVSSVKAALEAQVNPNAPIHAFLKANGLNLPTVLAGSAMGLNNLFDNYSRMLFTTRANNQEAQNIILRSRLETAKDMSEKVFHSKLTPNQVLAIMDAKEKGTPIPKGLEGAAQVYDQAVEINYQAAMAEAIQKGDPVVAAMARQLSALEKPGVDPYQLSAVRDMSARMGAYSMTTQQLGPMPGDMEGAARWNAVYEANLKRVPKTGVRMPYFHSDLPAEGGPASVGGFGLPAPTGMDRSSAGMRTGPGTQGAAGTSLPNPTNLSSEDQAAITNYLQTILPVAPTGPASGATMGTKPPGAP